MNYMKDHIADQAALNAIREAIIRQAGGATFPGGLTMDAVGTLFSAKALEYIHAEIYKVQYANIKAREVFPLDNSGGEWTDSVTYRVMDYTGRATRLNINNATNIPLIALTAKEVTNRVRHVASKYAYSMMELARAQHANLPLDRESAFAARDAVEREIDTIAWFGDADMGLEGFLNNGQIPVGDVPNGAGGTPQWATKTPDEILKDVLNIFAEISQITKGVESADTLLLPLKQYNLLKQPRSGFSDTSLIKWIADNVPELRGNMDNIIPVPVLEGAGTAGVDIMIAYKKDPRKLSMLLPMDIFVGAPELKELSWETIIRASTGSVVVRYPLSVNIKEKI